MISSCKDNSIAYQSSILLSCDRRKKDLEGYIVDSSALNYEISSKKKLIKIIYINQCPKSILIEPLFYSNH